MIGTPCESLERMQALFTARFGEARDFIIASTPGRIELAGNHTDHQGGKTIAAAIDRRTYALAAANDTDEIRVFMKGFGEATLYVTELAMREDEKGTSVGLIRGMAAAYVRAGGTLCGFSMVTSSDIPVGCGVSSSAAFEVLVGTVIRTICGPLSKEESTTRLALEGVWAERTYFGKPCGAQDQIASAYGGVIAMDFAEEVPKITPIHFGECASGYTICLIDSRCDHSHHTDEYAAIPADMHAVAHFFDRSMLEEVSFPEFLDQFAHVREHLGDRAALRALHYFEETRRVEAQRLALAAHNFEAFLDHVRMSGASSAQFLQNVSPHCGASNDQPAMVILALCAHLLGGRGAYRIHGGGFGGSVLAFVPNQQAESFMASLNTLLGYDACMSVSIGSIGATAKRLV